MKIVGLVLVLFLACWSYAATGSEEATTRLSQAIDRYSALDFATAGQLLRSVDREALAEADRATLDNYLGHVEDALAAQNEARRRLVAGERALAAGDLAEAQTAFLEASRSEYLDASSRKLAKTRLIAVQQQLQSASPTVVTPDELLGDATVVELVSESTDDHRSRPVFDEELLLAEATDDERPSVPEFHELSATSDEPTEQYTHLLQAGKEALAEDQLADAAAYLRQAVMEDGDTSEAAELLRHVQQVQQDQAVETLMAGADVDDVASQEIATFALLGAETESDELTAEMVTADDAAMIDVADTAGAVNAGMDVSLDAGPSADPSNALSRTLQMTRIRKGAAEGQYEKAITRANQALASTRDELAASDAGFNQADTEVLVARDVLETNKNLFTSEELRTMQAKLDVLSKSIASQRRAWQEAEKERIRAIQIEAEEKRVEAVATARQASLEALRVQANTLMADGNLEGALSLVDEMLEIDPQNLYAKQLQIPLQNLVTEQLEKGIRETRDVEAAVQALETQAAMIQWNDELIYPDDWVERSRRRLSAIDDRSSESEENRRVYQALEKRYSRFEFNDVDFETVINYFTTISGISFHVKSQQLIDTGVTPSQAMVKINLWDVKLEKALRIVLEDISQTGAPLGYYVDDGVITISTKSDLDTNTTTRIYDISDLLVRIRDFPGPRLNLSSSSDSAVADPFQQREEEEDVDRDELIQQVTDLIENSIDNESWGVAASMEEMSGQLVITQTPENHRRISTLLGELRESRAIQVIIESRFIEVDTSFMERVGIDLDVYFNIGSKWASQDYVDPELTIGEETQTIYGYPNFTATDPPEYRWTRGQGNDRWSGSTIQRINSQHKAQSNQWTPVAIETGNKLNWVTAATGVGMDIGSAAMGTPTAFSVAGAFLDDIEVDFLMEATQGSVTRRVLTAPRLTLFNGQRAYISVATQSSYVQSWDTKVAQGTASMSPVLGYVPTGSVLDVEANVSHDRRYVTLTVRPQVAELIAFRDPVDFQGGPGTSGRIELPQVRVKELKTTVSVPDGGTLMLGGQKLAGVMEREVGPPVLSKVPVINRLFTGRGLTQDETTLLVLVRPQIIIQREEEEKAFP